MFIRTVYMVLYLARKSKRAKYACTSNLHSVDAPKLLKYQLYWITLINTNAVPN